MITEDYVSFELAKLLKERGFDERCRQYWYKGNIIFSRSEIRNGELDNYEEEGWTAPTLQMAMKWLREVHTIIIELHHQYRKEWYAIVSSENPLGIGVYTTSIFNTYEEACEAAIKYCLNNLI